MIIELKCPCGGELKIDTEGHDYYIQMDGFADDKGRRFNIQVQADAWLDRHNNCLLKKGDSK